MSDLNALFLISMRILPTALLFFVAAEVLNSALSRLNYHWDVYRRLGSSVIFWVLAVLFQLFFGMGSIFTISALIFFVASAVTWLISIVYWKVSRVRRQNVSDESERLQDYTQTSETNIENSSRQRKIGVNMKRIWIIPAIICLLLLAAWPFRWEKGPAQTMNGGELKVVHLRDRWTGQAWIALYGLEDEKIYSGELVPIPSEADIEKRKKQILARPKEAKKMVELKKKLSLPALYGGGEEAEWKIQEEEDHAKAKAKSELKRLAWRKRTTVTEIWAGLSALSAIMACILFAYEARAKKKQNVKRSLV